MKVVISCTGPSPTDLVDPRFGRARYLLLYDSVSESYVSIDNSEQVQAAQGAGVQAAQKVVGLEPQALLTGRCGPKAFQILAEAGVAIYSGFQGTVLEAVEAWRKGDLEPLAAADGISHN
jgi:predicted Fe-Mo cluster-binding NifX family protein